jgi:hypothetical protein
VAFAKFDGGAAGVPLRAGEVGDDSRIVTYPNTESFVFDRDGRREVAK